MSYSDMGQECNYSFNSINPFNLFNSFTLGLMRGNMKPPPQNVKGGNSATHLGNRLQSLSFIAFGSRTV